MVATSAWAATRLSLRRPSAETSLAVEASAAWDWRQAQPGVRALGATLRSLASTEVEIEAAEPERGIGRKVQAMAARPKLLRWTQVAGLPGVRHSQSEECEDLAQKDSVRRRTDCSTRRKQAAQALAFHLQQLGRPVAT